MSWLVVKTTLSKFWVWLKEYWQIPFLLVWSILVWILARRNTDAMVDVMKARKDSYERQIEILKSSHNDELLKRDNLIKKYEDSLKKVEEEFRKKEKKLSENQKNEIKEVIIKSKGNSDEIKKRISDKFGFTLVE